VVLRCEREGLVWSLFSVVLVGGSGGQGWFADGWGVSGRRD
jgi:hypothetical protein